LTPCELVVGLLEVSLGQAATCELGWKFLAQKLDRGVLAQELCWAVMEEAKGLENL